jgi:hypothetical protein
MNDTENRQNKVISLSEEATKRGRWLPSEQESASELKADLKQYILDYVKTSSDSQPMNPDKIQCPVCNNNPARAAITCPDCGYPLREHLKDEHIEAFWKKSKKWLIILGCSSFVGYVLSMKFDSSIIAGFTIVLLVLLLSIVINLARMRGKNGT